MSEEEQTQEGQATAYELLGGEEKVFALVDRFYDLMDEMPEYYGIRKLHPVTLDGSRSKLKMYLSGWLGGPNLYIEQFGHPRLRARHLPFSIGMDERNQWLACMYSAMEQTGVPEELQTRLQEAFFGTADWMRNREN
ncbi:MAG: Hemoglobin-like protein HbO [Betaproteobacteria bacterium]|nr:Hemoglobin-like protein HbO [Betaproteobacteria bacterium]